MDYITSELQLMVQDAQERRELTPDWLRMLASNTRFFARYIERSGDDYLEAARIYSSVEQGSLREGITREEMTPDVIAGRTADYLRDSGVREENFEAFGVYQLPGADNDVDYEELVTPEVIADQLKQLATEAEELAQNPTNPSVVESYCQSVRGILDTAKLVAAATCTAAAVVPPIPYVVASCASFTITIALFEWACSGAEG